MGKFIKFVGKFCLSIIGIIVVGIIVLLIKNTIHSHSSWLKKDYYTQFQSDSELETKYAGIGEYEVSHIAYDFDDVLKKIRIWYPKELENNSEKYPLVVVTNASGMAAKNYEAFFERLASWGFVVVGNDDRQAGTGLSTSKTLDYILGLNKDTESVLFGKIDSSNIGAIGYSQGGAGAINAVTAFENSHNYSALFTGSAAYPLLATNMGWGYDISKVTIPYFMTAGTGNSDDTGVMDIDKDYGGVAPLASLVQNYDGMTDEVFKIRGRITGAEHEEMQSKTDGYMTAWMLYQLREDENASKVFLGEDSEILSNGNWQDVVKNN